MLLSVWLELVICCLIGAPCYWKGPGQTSELY